MKKLYENILEEIGKRGLEEIAIPTHITENLGRELREYQTAGLKYFLANQETIKQNHLMFNMATGSGKTLMMAALMLECYKNGYRDFVFLVHSRTILEKTKANFTAPHDDKYLFTERVIIDGRNVEINAVKNLNESKEGAINIQFESMQKMTLLDYMEGKEDAFNLQDFAERKVVFIADEAHHLNANTKKKGQKDDNERNWEAIINKAFMSHPENLMLEFTATIPDELPVLEKYRDKIIYEYDLKKYCQDGYSKRVFLMRYSNQEKIEDRLLGGVLMSLYRELIAQEYGISLKPVVLFKSEGIPASRENQKRFLELLENLEARDIEAFYAPITPESELFYKSLEYFRGKFGESYAHKLREYLKSNFKEIFILNTNDGDNKSKKGAKDKEVSPQQYLLNTLEKPENVIRVIFSVEMLNEGWDVLNLFDIVRLGNKKVSKSKKPDASTTKEVQLIGRGARYYPFSTPESPELAHKRKFDNKAEHPLSALECLSYHTINDPDFIRKLNHELIRQGLENDACKKVVLNLTEHARKVTQARPIYYATNHRYEDKTIKISPQELETKLENLSIPLITDDKHQSEAILKPHQEEESRQKNKKIGISEIYFLKAMNMENLSFELLSQFCSCESKREFIEELREIKVNFDSKQQYDPEHCLKIARHIIKELKAINEKSKQKKIYKAGSLNIDKLQMQKREIFTTKEACEPKRGWLEWLYYDKYLKDSELEEDFLGFIDSRKDAIDEAFEEWFVIRNDGFEEFKIYDFLQGEKEAQDKEKESIKGFEPDFIFFGRRKGEERFSSIQCFIEAKGEHLVGRDEWKANLLDALKNKELSKQGNTLKLESLPFFTEKTKNEKFDEEFEKFLQGR